jgi:NADH-quinone oxidoreductase subunit N
MLETKIGLNDLLKISPLIVLFIVSLIPITIKVLRGNIENSPIKNMLVALSGIIVACMFLFTFSGGHQPVFHKAMVFDGITLWVGFIALVGAAGAVVLSYESLSTNRNLFSEYIFLILSSTIGMLILISAIDLLVVFIGLEIMSLSLYLMIAMSNEDKLSKESALKYFILGSFASAILLYGIALIFGSASTTYLMDIFNQVPNLMMTSRIFLFGVGLVILGFCFKVSIFPFHAWTPDVYQGAPTPLTAYMATAVKAASFAAFIRFLSIRSLDLSLSLLNVLQWLAVITMIVGNVAALRQNQLKRVLAYSSIAHSGYLLIGIIATCISDTGTGELTSVIFYLISYSIMTFGALAIISIFEKSENTILNVDDLAGLAQERPYLALALTILLLSLAGIPPTIGFFGKFYMFTMALSQGLLWAVIWGVVNSVISVYYYLRPVVVMYMHDRKEGFSIIPSNATQVIILITTILVLSLGLLSDVIFKVVEKSFL